MSQGRISRPAAVWPWLLMIGLLALWIPLYLLVRFQARWTEFDTAQAVDTSRSVQEQGKIIPEGAVYSHGYGSQLIATFVSDVTDVSIATLLIAVFPFFTFVIVIAAFALYRQILDDRRIGAFAAILLLLQPDVLFILLRGNHEKFGMLLVIVALLLMTKGLRLLTSGGRSIRSYGPLVLLFYLAIFGMIALNHFFASVFILGLIASLSAGWLIRRFRPETAPVLTQHIGQLNYAVTMSVVLVFVSMFYIYEPSESILRLLPDALDRIATLFLDVEVSENPYQPITSGWVNLPTYIALNAITLLILPLSFLGWLREGWRRFIRKNEDRPLLTILWLVYFGFGLQMAFAIVADSSGFLGANLQLRVFSKFMIVAVPFAALLIVDFINSPGFGIRARHAARVAVALAVGGFAITAILKATLDPAVSNRWLFHTSGEETALTWVDSTGTYRDVWTGFDERLIEAAVIEVGGPSTTSNVYWGGDFERGRLASHVLISDVTRARSLRMQLPLPNVLDWQMLYDNGDVAIYQRPPLTPYQR